MPTPSEPEAARASRAAEKHARQGPGKAGPLPPCFCRRHITPPHCLVKGRNPKPKGFCSRSGGPHFFFGSCFPFIFGLAGLALLSVWSYGLPCEPCFPSILAFWAVISLNLGLWAGFLSVLALWAVISCLPGFVLAPWATQACPLLSHEDATCPVTFYVCFATFLRLSCPVRKKNTLPPRPRHAGLHGFEQQQQQQVQNLTKQASTACTCTLKANNAYRKKRCNLHGFGPFVRGIRPKRLQNSNIAFARSRSRYSVV